MLLEMPPQYGQQARVAEQSLLPELWRGLVRVYAPTLGPTPLLRDVNNWGVNKGTLTNGAAWRLGEEGWAMGITGSTSYVTSGTLAAINGVTEFTMAVRLKMDANKSVAFAYAQQTGTGGTTSINQLAWVQANNQWRARVDTVSNSNIIVDFGDATMLTEHVTLFVRFDNGTLTCRQNFGAPVTGSGNATTDSGTSDFRIGNSQSSTTASLGGEITFLAVWDYALSEDHWSDIVLDPFALIRHRPDIAEISSGDQGGAAGVATKYMHYQKMRRAC